METLLSIASHRIASHGISPPRQIHRSWLVDSRVPAPANKTLSIQKSPTQASGSLEAITAAEMVDLRNKLEQVKRFR